MGYAAVEAFWCLQATAAPRAARNPPYRMRRVRYGTAAPAPDRVDTGGPSQGVGDNQFRRVVHENGTYAAAYVAREGQNRAPWHEAATASEWTVEKRELQSEKSLIA